MKRFLIYSVILVLFGCNNNKIDDERYRNENYGWFVDEEAGKGEWVKLGNQKPDLSGDYMVFFFNGNVRETGRIKDGIHIDTTVIYDLDGNPIKYFFENADIKYHYYLIDGPYKAYHPNGVLMHEGMVKNNKKGIPWKEYYESGRISFDHSRINDSVSVKLHYFEFAGLMDSSGTLNGKDHGIQKKWYQNGKLRYISQWNYGLQDSTATIYFDNGNVMEVSNWEKDKKEGLTKGYFEKGGIAYIYYFERGQKNGIDTAYFENGNIRGTYTMKNGKRHGLAQAFYSNGKKYYDVIFKDGIIDNELKRYGFNGKLKHIDYYSKGKRINTKILIEFTEEEYNEMEYIKSENDRYQNLMH